MIESIDVSDFQNHRRLKVEFAPGVTAFTGKSFSGKSAALRALKWVLTNRPAGDSFVGRWRKAKRAKVTVRLDGHRISRLRGVGRNLYRLDGRPLKAFGSSPPQSVVDLAGVGPFNFQGQLDPPLWFTLSPAEVSRQLNDVVNLKSIDDALAKASSEVRRADAALVVSEERLQAALAERDGSAWAVEFAADVERLDCLASQLVKINARATGIASAVSGVSRAAAARRNAAEAILGVNPLVRFAQRHRELATRAGRLSQLTEQLDRCERLSEPIPGLGRLGKLRDRLAVVGERRRRLETTVHGSELVAMEYESLCEQAKKAEKEVKRRLGETCPTCGQPVPSPSSSGMRTNRTRYQSPVEKPVRSGIPCKRTTGGK